MGDFNFRFIKWNTNTEHLFCVPRIPDGDRGQYNQAHELIQLFSELFLLQYVAEGYKKHVNSWSDFHKCSGTNTLYWSWRNHPIWSQVDCSPNHSAAG